MAVWIAFLNAEHGRPFLERTLKSLRGCQVYLGVLTEEEYDDLMMEANENEEAVLEISDNDSKEEEIVEGVPAAEEVGGQDIQMILYDSNKAGMG